MSNRLAQLELALLCTPWWRFAKRYRIQKEIEVIKAVVKPWRREELIDGIIPSCNDDRI